MLRPYRPRLFSLLPVVALSAISAAAGRAGAQSYDPIVVPHQHAPSDAWCFLRSRPPIARTFSYQYQPWFDQPRRRRITRSDGIRAWQTTVRGLPLGTPGPPD